LRPLPRPRGTASRRLTSRKSYTRDGWFVAGAEEHHCGSVVTVFFYKTNTVGTSDIVALTLRLGDTSPLHYVRGEVPFEIAPSTINMIASGCFFERRPVNAYLSLYARIWRLHLNADWTETRYTRIPGSHSISLLHVLEFGTGTVLSYSGGSSLGLGDSVAVTPQRAIVADKKAYYLQDYNTSFWMDPVTGDKLLMKKEQLHRMNDSVPTLLRSDGTIEVLAQRQSRRTYSVAGSRGLIVVSERRVQFVFQRRERTEWIRLIVRLCM
jgi:hypothetical protein